MGSKFFIWVLAVLLFNSNAAVPSEENNHIKASHLQNSRFDRSTPLHSTTTLNNPSEAFLFLGSWRPIYPIKSSISEYTRVSTVGVTLERGTSATLKYNIRVNAIAASTLAKNDKRFVWKLTRKEQRLYWKVKSEYKNTLRIPWCWWLGMNLNQSSSTETMDYARKKQPNYNAKAWIARRLFKYTKPEQLTLSGELKVVGWSFIPTTYHAYIKTARVVLADGSTKIVVSSSADDLIAASARGVMGPSFNRKHKISG